MGKASSDQAKITLKIKRRLVTISWYLKVNFIDIYLSMLINAKCWSEIKVKARLELLVVCEMMQNSTMSTARNVSAGLIRGTKTSHYH